MGVVHKEIYLVPAAMWCGTIKNICSILSTCGACGDLVSGLTHFLCFEMVNQWFIIREQGQFSLKYCISF
jgi:hypothetical protein